jgi:hypothetical protein
MKYAVAIVTLILGTSLALSPMIFAQAGVHSDRLFHAQWAGFVVIICGIAMGFKAIGTKGEQPGGSEAVRQAG